jgi:hypothetical protein
MTHTLARLAVSWAAEDAEREPFVFNAGWWGISITHASSRDACHASAEASAPAILAARQAFESFGEWLRERYLAGELERQRFRRRALPK